METSIFIFIGFIIILLAIGMSKTSSWTPDKSKALLDRDIEVGKLTNEYNRKINELKREYDIKSAASKSSFFGNDKLKSEYSDRYTVIANEYKKKLTHMLNAWNKKNPTWMKERKTWGRIFMIGMLGSLIGCGAGLAESEEETQQTTSSVTSTAMSKVEPTYWNAKNIPMPHLIDSTQYVSNPDSILTQAAVDTMNIYLDSLDWKLGIESAVIVVGHIENDDPFRMAQDVGNNYGVGRKDRGLVVVMGYLDHSINISPGRALEADLTDAECKQLQETYVIPAMKVDKPDTAMVYLTKAIYSLMQKKEMPQMSSLLYSDDDDEEIPGSFYFHNIFLIGWAVFFSRKNRKYQWTNSAPGKSKLTPNPFYVYTGSDSDYSGGGGYSSGGGFSSSSSSGGSYGGGSFGGGGATSRW